MRFDDDSDDERQAPYALRNMQAIRRAGRSIIVAPFDPEHPLAAVRRSAETMIPSSQIDPTSEVKEPGDRGTLIIPTWLAVDRGWASTG